MIVDVHLGVADPPDELVISVGRIVRVGREGVVGTDRFGADGVAERVLRHVARRAPASPGRAGSHDAPGD